MSDDEDSIFSKEARKKQKLEEEATFAKEMKKKNGRLMYQNQKSQDPQGSIDLTELIETPGSTQELTSKNRFFDSKSQTDSSMEILDEKYAKGPPKVGQHTSPLQKDMRDFLGKGASRKKPIVPDKHVGTGGEYQFGESQSQSQNSVRSGSPEIDDEEFSQTTVSEVPKTQSDDEHDVEVIDTPPVQARDVLGRNSSQKRGLEKLVSKKKVQEELRRSSRKITSPPITSSRNIVSSDEESEFDHTPKKNSRKSRKSTTPKRKSDFEDDDDGDSSPVNLDRGQQKLTFTKQPTPEKAEKGSEVFDFDHYENGKLTRSQARQLKELEKSQPPENSPSVSKKEKRSTSPEESIYSSGGKRRKPLDEPSDVIEVGSPKKSSKNEVVSVATTTVMKTRKSGGRPATKVIDDPVERPLTIDGKVPIPIQQISDNTIAILPSADKIKIATRKSTPRDKKGSQTPNGTPRTKMTQNSQVNKLPLVEKESVSEYTTFQNYIKYLRRAGVSSGDDITTLKLLVETEILNARDSLMQVLEKEGNFPPTITQDLPCYSGVKDIVSPKLERVCSGCKNRDRKTLLIQFSGFHESPNEMWEHWRCKSPDLKKSSTQCLCAGCARPAILLNALWNWKYNMKVGHKEFSDEDLWEIHLKYREAIDQCFTGQNYNSFLKFYIDLGKEVNFAHDEEDLLLNESMMMRSEKRKESNDVIILDRIIEDDVIPHAIPSVTPPVEVIFEDFPETDDILEEKLL